MHAFPVFTHSLLTTRWLRPIRAAICRCVAPDFHHHGVGRSVTRKLGISFAHKLDFKVYVPTIGYERDNRRLDFVKVGDGAFAHCIEQLIAPE
jgi:hypothetical protein